jgi:hypothetical protein
VTNANRIYELITAGTSAGSGGPTTTAADITDNTAHWRYVGEGTAYAQVAAESVDTGPKVAASGTLTVIETPVARWESAINLLDAVNGRDVESDSALRLRREAEIHAQGNAVAEAIRADVLRVTDVTSVTVFANDTDVTDADGVPPHSALRRHALPERRRRRDQGGDRRLRRGSEDRQRRGRELDRCPGLRRCRRARRQPGEDLAHRRPDRLDHDPDRLARARGLRHEQDRRSLERGDAVERREHATRHSSENLGLRRQPRGECCLDPRRRK